MSEGPSHSPQPTGRKRLIDGLRWLAVPLAAWLGNYAGYILGGTLGLLLTRIGVVNPPSDDSHWNRSARYLIWMVPAGILCIVAGAKTAPRWRRITALLLAAWWILCVDFIHGFEGPTLYATALGGALGVIVVCYLERPTQPG